MTKAKKGKAKTSSQPNSAKFEKEPDASTSNSKMPSSETSTGSPPGPPPGPKPPVFPQSSALPQHTLPEATNANWIKVQTLDEELRIFLQPDNEKDTNGITSLKLYRILAHFNPKTRMRPTTLKQILWNTFSSDVLPLLTPCMLPPPSAPMDSEFSLQDFNPLSKKTTRKQLTDAVHSVNQKFPIPSATPRDRILVVYKAFVDKDLPLPWLTEYISSPKVVRPERVHELSMEELRMTLQEQAPHVFVHSGPMSLSVLANLYLRFVSEEPVADDLLVQGFHYSLFAKAA